MNGINDVVIVALIGLAGTVITASAAIICQIIINKKNNAKLRADELEKERIRAADAATKEEHMRAWMSEVERQLEETNRKLDIHNGYAEKIGGMSVDIAYIKGRMEGAA